MEKEPTKFHSDGEGERQPNGGNKDEMWRNYIGLCSKGCGGKGISMLSECI